MSPSEIQVSLKFTVAIIIDLATSGASMQPCIPFAELLAAAWKLLFCKYRQRRHPAIFRIVGNFREGFISVYP